MKIEKLTREAFARFGELITLDGAQHYPINEGTTERFHDPALIDVSDQNGKPLISLKATQTRWRLRTLRGFLRADNQVR